MWFIYDEVHQIDGLDHLLHMDKFNISNDAYAFPDSISNDAYAFPDSSTTTK